jgi:hypothetical protein
MKQRTKCTARVYDPLIPLKAPTGLVTWSGGSGTFHSPTCAIKRRRGSCTVSFRAASVGAQTITASYSGDANHNGDEESTTIQVGRG